MSSDSTERTLIPILISKADCASILGVSVRAIDYLITNKKLESRRLGRRVLVVRRTIRSLSANRSAIATLQQSATSDLGAVRAQKLHLLPKNY
jgi:hypothetical protein